MTVYLNFSKYVTSSHPSSYLIGNQQLSGEIKLEKKTFSFCCVLYFQGNIF
jgi:hypothetical protein